MQLLKERIRKDGKIMAGNVLKVDSFLNHQMDTELFQEIGKEFRRRFADVQVNKILTIEASGIGIACVVAQSFHVPVVFAKKTKTKNIAGDVYTSKVERYCWSMISWPTVRRWRVWPPWWKSREQSLREPVLSSRKAFRSEAI